MTSEMFKYHDPAQSEHRKRIYAAFELWYTAVDVGAAISFLVGSLLFLSEETKTIGTYLFIGGSLLFLFKPTIRLMRESKYAASGEIGTLANRAGWTSKDTDRS